MSFLDSLGIDVDDFTWKDLAVCQGLDHEMFFSQYESNPSVRQTVDQMCESCPVRRDCLMDGLENKQHGVRGGWYLNGSGNIDKQNTKHKTDDDRDDLRRLISGE